jgi:phosphoribosylaminoimidazolecarboxamide formyltransferase / IMP cyclohydrolase
MYKKKIKSALVSVFNKDHLGPIIELLGKHNVKIYSTGGTQAFIESLNVAVEAVESLTSYPSILDGRVKTLHPKIFGGLLARREEKHLSQLEALDIPEIDLVIVDLYPFEETLASTDNEEEIIEKIDIGGISLIRAAAKNFKDVVVISSRDQYQSFFALLEENNCYTELEDRSKLAREAFMTSSHYDTAIYQYFARDTDDTYFKQSILTSTPLRYGENPHQRARFYGDLDQKFENLNGKAISYNNLVDIDAAIRLMSEFQNDDPTFAILKHTNACGLSTRSTILKAWKDALACDNISAFGGVLISNTTIDLETAVEIDKLFYEVLMAPGFDAAALDILKQKKNRILLQIKNFNQQPKSFKTLLNGVIEQDADHKTESKSDLKFVTNIQPTESEIEDLLYANKCVKHLKSNGIALVKNKQLIAMGCGQTSRVDALMHAIRKAGVFGFDLRGAVMASEAFFPFADCVQIAHEVGIHAVIQPGGSVKDVDSIQYCNEHDMAMVMTGVRHFLH